MLGPWSKPAEQVLCDLKRWKTLLHMNLCFARLSLNESEICPFSVELSFVLCGKSFPGSGRCNCGAKLSLFIWGRLRVLSVGRCAKEQWEQWLEGTARSQQRVHPVGMRRVAQGEAENEREE